MGINDRIKARRLELDVPVEELAAKLGVSRATIYRYESAEIKNMGIDKVEPLARALKTTPAYLMGWTDDPHDWEQIGNDEGICPPRDYEGTYEDYVKYKVQKESDDLIDSYYDIYNEAAKYLRGLGCTVADIPATSKISIVVPGGEHMEIDVDDLVYNFMIFGASCPGVKKLITPRKTDLKDEEKVLINRYRALDNRGKHTVDTVLEMEYNRCTKPHLMPVAAHNDDNSEEELEKMRRDLEDL